MGMFANRSCMALTWTADGQCRGVHLLRTRDGCRLLRSWASGPDQGKSIAARLAAGFRELACQANTVVVAGGGGSRAAFVDLEMPELKPDELRSALTFEVARFAPIATEKLVWGYRTLPANGDGRLVRLIFLREEEWTRWLDHVSGLGHGLDCVMPPETVTDPLFRDREVWFGPDGNGLGFRAVPNPPAGRCLVRAETAAPAAFGALPEPLAAPEFEAGELADLDAAEQQGYVGAVLLGMYGLTAAPKQDRHGWIPIPFELRPRRHRHSRLLAVALATLLLIVAGVGIGREYSAANSYAKALQEDCRLLRRQLNSVSAEEQSTELADGLRRELRDAQPRRPQLAGVLLELTQLIDTDAWVQSFTWTDGKIQVLIRTDVEDIHLLERLEASLLLGDVLQLRRQVGPDGMSISVQMNARYDTENEEAATQVGPAPTDPGS